MAKKQNSVKMVGFVGFPKKVSDTFFVGQLSFTVNTGTKEAPVNKYVNIKIQSKEDLTAFDKKRVQIEGFFSGEEFQERSTLKIVVMKISELSTGRGENEVVLTTMTNFVKTGEGEQKWMSASGSISFNTAKQGEPDNYKYANIDISGSKALELKDGEVVTLKGFLGGSFFTPKGSDKEVNKPKLTVTAVVSRGVPEGSSTDEAPAPATKPAEEISEDEIPF